MQRFKSNAIVTFTNHLAPTPACVAARCGRAFGNLCHLGNASTLDLVLLWRGMQRGGYTCPFLARPARSGPTITTISLAAAAESGGLLA